VELLLLLLEQGFEVEEFPVDWHDVKGSKVNLLKDSLQMTLEVFRIKRRIRMRRTTAVTEIKQSH
jgi:dolichyl-phosphate beta-glucosyltransferase